MNALTGNYHKAFSCAPSLIVGEETLFQNFSADFPLDLIRQNWGTAWCLAAKEAGKIITGVHPGRQDLSAKIKRWRNSNPW